jgi:hypothetical protein
MFCKFITKTSKVPLFPIYSYLNILILKDVFNVPMNYAKITILKSLDIQ